MRMINWARKPLGIMVFGLFCWSFALAAGIPSSFRAIEKLWNSGLIYCGRDSLQFTVPANYSDAIPLLTVLDSAGYYRHLHSSACGVSISWKQDGSIVFMVPYAGCFFIKKNSNFLMTLRIEGRDAVGKVISYEEELRCRNHLPVLDAPSSSECLGILRPDWLPCAAHGVSQAECEGKGCCYSPEDSRIRCYYGNTVTAHCTPDGHFSIAISRDVTLPSLNLDSVHLVSGRGSGCSPVAKTNAFVLYKFPLSACGTTFQGTEDQGIYANELMAHQDVQNSNTGSITRDSTFRLYVTCTYSTGDFLPLSIEVATLPPPHPITQYGPLNLELRIASDQHYSDYYADRDYPLVKLLRDPVFLEVRILQRTDPNLVLVLHECWATPSTNPMQRPQWPILVSSCPYDGDNYQTQLVLVGAASGIQFPSHYQRFVVSTFTFVDSTSQQALTGRTSYKKWEVPFSQDGDLVRGQQHVAHLQNVSIQTSCRVIQLSGGDYQVLGTTYNTKDPKGTSRRMLETRVLQDTPRSLVTTEGAVDFQINDAQPAPQKGSHLTRPILSEEWERALVVSVGALFVAVAFVGIRKYWQRTN